MNTSSSSDDGSEKIPGDDNDSDVELKNQDAVDHGDGTEQKPAVKNNKIQEKLEEIGCNIPITTNRIIKGTKWP